MFYVLEKKISSACCPIRCGWETDRFGGGRLCSRKNCFEAIKCNKTQICVGLKTLPTSIINTNLFLKREAGVYVKVHTTFFSWYTCRVRKLPNVSNPSNYNLTTHTVRRKFGVLSMWHWNVQGFSGDSTDSLQNLILVHIGSLQLVFG